MSGRLAKALAVVATTPDDSHVWNLIGVQLELEARGFKVENLGPCTPPELVAETVRDRRPDLLAISTINGHGAISMRRVLQVLDDYQLKRATRIVVGGLLTTDSARSAIVADELRAAGCAGVFVGETAWRDFDAAFSQRSKNPQFRCNAMGRDRFDAASISLKAPERNRRLS